MTDAERTAWAEIEPREAELTKLDCFLAGYRADRPEVLAVVEAAQNMNAIASKPDYEMPILGWTAIDLIRKALDALNAKEPRP